MSSDGAVPSHPAELAQGRPSGGDSGACARGANDGSSSRQRVVLAA